MIYQFPGKWVSNHDQREQITTQEKLIYPFFCRVFSYFQIFTIRNTTTVQLLKYNYSFVNTSLFFFNSLASFTLQFWVFLFNCIYDYFAGNRIGDKKKSSSITSTHGKDAKSLLKKAERYISLFVFKLYTHVTPVEQKHELAQS